MRSPRKTQTNHTMNQDKQTMKAPPRADWSLRRSPLMGAASGLLLACSLGVGVPVVAQGDRDEIVTRSIPSQVDAILHGMSDLLGSSKGLTLRAEIIHDDALESGLLVQRVATLEIVIDRPGSIHGVMTEGGEQRKLWCDGKNATLYDLAHNVFTQTEVPGKIGPALDFLMEKYGISLPLADFLFEDPYEALTGNVERAIYVGQAEVDGVTCHQLVFSQDAIDWQLWVEAGVRPAPRRLLIVYKLLPGSPRYIATLSDLRLRSTSFPVSFTPILPDDADEIEMLEIKSVVDPK